MFSLKNLARKELNKKLPFILCIYVRRCKKVIIDLYDRLVHAEAQVFNLNNRSLVVDYTLKINFSKTLINILQKIALKLHNPVSCAKCPPFTFPLVGRQGNFHQSDCSILNAVSHVASNCCWAPHCLANTAYITIHYDDVIMDSIASQITSLTIVYSTVHSGADQSKHQSSASLAFVWEIHRWPVNFPHKWPVTPKMFPVDDVIMITTI